MVGVKGWHVGRVKMRKLTAFALIELILAIQ